WMNLGQHGQRIGIAGVDNVTFVDLLESDNPIEWRRNGRVGKLRLRTLDGALIGFDRSLQLVDLRLLLVNALRGRKTFAAQIEISLEVLLRRDEHGCVLCLLALRFIERRLERARIDQSQYIALVDLLPLVEFDSYKLAVHLAADRHQFRRAHSAECTEENGN